MPVEHKTIEDILVASKRIHGKFIDIPRELEIIGKIVGKRATGRPIIVHHWLVQDQDGHDMDVCVPMTQSIDENGIKSMILEKCEAMTMVHNGPYETIGETYREITKETYAHGLPIAESGREVLIRLDLNNPEKNVIEIQEVLHNWDELFAENLEAWLGTEDSEEIMECYEGLTCESSLEDRVEAIKCAMITLDKLATDEQKFEILSQCAHIFPPELIERMRIVYDETYDIDKVLVCMEETGNYPKFTREGNILYSSKQPYNPQAFAKATSHKEKMQAYCYCPMIKYDLDYIRESFCYCGSGWVRRLWEGILGESVRVELVKTLTKGDDECTFAIHLPVHN